MESETGEQITYNSISLVLDGKVLESAFSLSLCSSFSHIT